MCQRKDRGPAAVGQARPFGADRGHGWTRVNSASAEGTTPPRSKHCGTETRTYREGLGHDRFLGLLGGGDGGGGGSLQSGLGGIDGGDGGILGSVGTSDHALLDRREARVVVDGVIDCRGDLNGLVVGGSGGSLDLDGGGGGEGLCLGGGIDGGLLDSGGGGGSGGGDGIGGRDDGSTGSLHTRVVI